MLIEIASPSVLKTDLLQLERKRSPPKPQIIEIENLAFVATEHRMRFKDYPDETRRIRKIISQSDHLVMKGNSMTSKFKASQSGGSYEGLAIRIYQLNHQKKQVINLEENAPFVRLHREYGVDPLKAVTYELINSFLRRFEEPDIIQLTPNLTLVKSGLPEDLVSHIRKSIELYGMLYPEFNTIDLQPVEELFWNLAVRLFSEKSGKETMVFWTNTRL